MVTSWLLNSLSKDIADSVIYSRTAKELWIDLEQRFGQSNGAKLYHLQKEISGLAQGSTDIAGYFTRLKRLWDELDSLNSHVNCMCMCTCKGKQKIAKSLEDQRLMHFLMGLNDVYSQARGNILMLNPLPGINQAYSLLLQDENQREVYVNPQYSPNSSSFMARNYNASSQKFTKQTQRFGNNNTQRFKSGNQMQGQRFGNRNQRNPNQSQRTGAGFKPRKAKFNPNVSCTDCFKIGHLVDDCYRLHGFPDDFELTNQKEYNSAVKGNAAVAGEEHESIDTGYNDAEINSITQQLSK
ncbi:uncharacterized protein LOC132048752 [Lycium ferocissimum]|uniref:uncharacterized protein LOC132048752 n=1 Tax=Lycium ferocissimum TaxID=112874 RepID=UPI0028151469|nr:uncharacterized protein LOC132048752 [Lycium ferocissimum]